MMSHEQAYNCGLEDGFADCVSNEHAMETSQLRFAYLKGFKEGQKARHQ